MAFVIYNHSHFTSHVAMFYKNRIRKIRRDCKNRLTGYRMKVVRKNGIPGKLRKAK
jgi:hypothetical protein